MIVVRWGGRCGIDSLVRVLGQEAKEAPAGPHGSLDATLDRGGRITMIRPLPIYFALPPGGKL